MLYSDRYRDHHQPIKLDPEKPRWRHPSNARKCADVSWTPDNPLSEHACLRKSHDASQHFTSSRSCFVQDRENSRYPLPASYKKHSYDAHGHRIHHHSCPLEVQASIPYLRYGVHNNEMLDKYFYYNPCEFAWITRESNTQAGKSVIPLLEQEARSSGGLNYRGIFNHLIAFHNGHWIPVVKETRAENDVARHSELSRETAHRADGRRVENLKNLVVK
jgi:hypothetical protein